MASPFRVFRKHQKTMLVVLGLLAMMAFVVLPILLERLGMQGGGRVNQAVANCKRYGNLDQAALQHLFNRRQTVLQFIQQVAREVEKAGGNTMVVTSQMEPGGPIGQMDEESVVETWLLSNYAEEQGLVVDDDTITNYLRDITIEQKLTEEDVNAILARSKLSRVRLYDILREHLLANQILRMFAVSLDATTPEQRWDYFKKLKHQASIEVVPIPVAQLVEEVPAPDETGLREFFERHKENESYPSRPDPGFYVPHQAVVEYLKADVRGLPKIPEADLLAHYESFKDERYRKPEEVAPRTPTPKPATGSESGEDAPATDAPAEDAPAEDAPAEDAPAMDVPAEDAPAEDAPAMDVPAEDAPAENAPAEDAPAEDAPAEDAPAEDAPAEDAPAEDAPAEDAPAMDVPAEDAPAEDAPAEDAPAMDVPAEDAPAEDAPAEDAPAEDAPAEDAPAEDAPASDAPAMDVPAEDAPAEDAPAEDAPAEDAPAEDAPAEDAPAMDVPAEDAPAEDAPAMDVPAEDAPAEDAPAEDAPAMDAPAMDAPAEDAPAEDAPAEDAPAMDVPATDAPATDAPAEDAPAEDAPAMDVPAEDAPAEDAPAMDAPAMDVPAEDAPAEDAPAMDVPATDAPATDAPAEDAPAEDAPAEDAPASDAPAEDAPAMDVPAEDAPAEDAPAEDAPAEDAPAEDAPPEDAPATDAPATDAGSSMRVRAPLRFASYQSAPAENESEEPVPPAAEEPVPPAAEEPVPPAAEEPTPPAAEEPVPPAAEEPVPPAAEEPTPPAGEEPVPPAAEEPVPPTAEQPAAPIVEESEPEGSVYIPFEEVKEDIQRELGTDQVLLVFHRIRDQLKQYTLQRTLSRAEWEGGNKDVVIPDPPDLSAIAEEHDFLVYGKTDMLTALSLSETDLGRTRELTGGLAMLEHFFGGARQGPDDPFSPLISLDTAGNHFLVWKIEEREPHVPEFEEEGVRDEVLRQWQMVQARVLARNRTRQLAAEAGESGKATLREFCVDKPNLRIVESAPFTWQSFDPMTSWFVQRRPRISPIKQDILGGSPHLDAVTAPGNAFMQSVFELKPGEFGSGMNEPETAAYVFRVVELNPSPPVLWDLFVSESYSTYASLHGESMGEAYRAWIEGIRSEVGFEWIREPAQRSRR